VTTVPTRQNRMPISGAAIGVMLSIGIVITVIGPIGHRFSEETLTSVSMPWRADSSARGRHARPAGYRPERQIGRGTQGEVVEIGESHSGKSEVGIEFLEPSPRFWRIAFPPEDWSAPAPKLRFCHPAPVSPLKAPLPK